MAKKKALPFENPEKIRAVRKALKLTQGEFWERIGVTQSGGSRYETGRAVPPSTVLLLQVVYGSEKESAELVAALRDY